MAQTFATGKKPRLVAKLNPADTTATIDTDVGITAGRLYLVNNNAEEWISFTGVSASGSNFSYTGLTRGLSQTADPSTAGTGLTWLANQECILVAMHDQMVDKDEETTFRDNIKFNNVLTAGINAQQLTTAQRTALTPVNGAIVYDTDIGELYQYIGGSWSAVSAGSTQPNGSETVAGKFELSTTGQSQTPTDIGETGAILVVKPSTIANNSQYSVFKTATASGTDTYTAGLTPAVPLLLTNLSKYRIKFTNANTGASTLNIDGLGAKAIINRSGVALVAGDIPALAIIEMTYDGTSFVLEREVGATETAEGIVELSTDAEATIGTEQNKAVTPNQLTKFNTITFTRDVAGTSGDVNYAHGFGKVPKFLEFVAMDGPGTTMISLSNGTYDGTTNTAITLDRSSGTGIIDATKCIVISQNSAAGQQKGAVSALDATNITITWTKVGTPAGTITGLIKIYG